MLRKVRNPFTGHQGYNCFGCSPDNPIGLRLNFVDEGDIITATWQINPDLQGYNNVLHGGIQATLLDEIASWYVYVKLKTAGVTSKLDVKYKKPVYVTKGPILLKARLQEHRHNLADIRAELFDSDHQLCAEGVIQYFTFPEKIARDKYFYPEAKDFYFGEEK